MMQYLKEFTNIDLKSVACKVQTIYYQLCIFTSFAWLQTEICNCFISKTAVV